MSIPATVKITLKQPFSAFINILAHPATAMISPQALEKYGAILFSSGRYRSIPA
ncbi:hypothetical protein KCP73_03025 [Salmonella enterica subsp. enterica]|nr:hypothetical protein KCP73_03025 [Salmonella enterica subsp. enterica]